ncbi:MAG: tetratricopeptide repeat protein, partial [Bacteroidetes bacterium]|nr:tetratricopeptide repeat protein [Bacteroidota bacterium]
DDPIVYDNRGDAYSGLHQYEEALSDYERCLILAPDNCNPHYGMGMIYIKRNELQKACFHFNEAVRLGCEEAVDKVRERCE